MLEAAKNIRMVWRELFLYSPKMKGVLIVYSVFKVAVPLVESGIPALAIALITSGSIEGYVLGIVGLILLDVVLRAAQAVMSNRLENGYVGTRLERFMVRLLGKSLFTDYCNVEPAPRQKIIGKGAHSVFGNTVGVEGLLRNSSALFISVFGILTYGAVIVRVHWIILFLILVITAVDFLLNRHAVRFSDKLSDERYQAGRTNQYLSRQGISLSHGKDIRMYRVEGWFHSVFEKQIGILKRCYRRQEVRWYLPTLAEQFEDLVRNFILYWILVKMVLDGEISAAQFAFYVGVVSSFAIWTHDFVGKISSVMTSAVETGYYNEAMELPNVFSYGTGEKPDFTSPVSIEFRDVSFHYEGSEEEILSHLSFRIRPGQKIALVGNNGAGKTTVVKLICGFYMPTEGEVLVNGKSTAEYDMDEYRKLFSPVFQDGFVSAFSVALNVAGVRNFDRERVRDCLKRAGIWEKIDGLDKKEDTFISQILDGDGVEFSGGEIQKILIARALYKDSRMLILDEPTSALDPIAESKIYERYHEMTQDKTALFISHRLASTRFCDEILYLDHGSVAERGTHKELMERGGAYAGMFEIQSHYYKEEVSEDEK